MRIGRGIGQQEFQAYDKTRVAGLSENERRGLQLAREGVGIGQPYFDEAADYARRGTQSWTDTDQSKYINPYIKGALDPAARELQEYGARALTGVTDRASSMDAWGRRSHIEKADIREKTLQGLSDLYGEGYARAYEWGAQMFGQERARDMEAAGRFSQLGGAVIDARQTDISTLMTTGATDRSIQQALMDFDWQQFVEERDWGFRQLMGVVSALEGTKGSYTTTQTTDETVKKDNTAEIVGAIAQIVSAAYMSGSDERLKENIIYIGTYMGHKLYAWTWNKIAMALGFGWQPNIGVIAQEVIDTNCVMLGTDGFLRVNYRKLFGG